MELLAESKSIGRVERCEHGCVHLNIINGVSLYFTTDAFMSLASVVGLAASKIMEEGLTELLRDFPEKESDK